MIKCQLSTINIMETKIDLKTRIIHTYSNIMLGDAIDGYITELERDAINCGMYRQSFKSSINKMKISINRYKLQMFQSSKIGDKVKEKLVEALDILDDEFRDEIKLYYLSIRQFLLDKVNSDHATLIARASVIESLSQYSLCNDNAMSKLLSKIGGRLIISKDMNMQAINYSSKEFVRHFSRLYKGVEINLNDCDTIFKSFEIIDNKISHIPDFIYKSNNK